LLGVESITLTENTRDIVFEVFSIMEPFLEQTFFKE